MRWFKIAAIGAGILIAFLVVGSVIGAIFHILTDLVIAALVVGAIVVAVFIGWAIDHWLGTRPWGMVVFFFLGIAAGMLNVYRAVTGLGRAVGFKQDAPGNPGTGWDDEDET